MGWGAPPPDVGAASGAGPLVPELEGAAARCGGEDVVRAGAGVVCGAEYVTSDVALGVCVRGAGAGARRFATCRGVRRTRAWGFCVRVTSGRRGCGDSSIAGPLGARRDTPEYRVAVGPDPRVRLTRTATPAATRAIAASAPAVAASTPVAARTNCPRRGGGCGSAVATRLGRG